MVSVVGLPFVSATDVNVVLNPSFETTAGWPYMCYAWLGGDWETVTDVAGHVHSGVYAAVLVYPVGEYGNLYHPASANFDVPSGNVTEASVWVYSHSAGVIFTMIMGYGDGPSDFDEVSVEPTPNTWTKLSFNLALLTPSVNYHDVSIMTYGTDLPDIAYVDDIAIMSNNTAESTASPVVTTDVTDVTLGGDWAGAMKWLVIMVLMFVPTLVFGVLLRGGKWGFLLGLAVGTGLSYAIFPLWFPIWLVILVGMGLGAAFLTTIRSGG